MIKKTDAGRYRVRITFKGRQVAMATFDRKGEAEAWETEQKRALRFGTWVHPKLGDMPLGELVEKFNVARRGAVGDHTWDTDEANLRLHVPADLRRLPIGSIQKVRLNTLFVAMLRTHARGTVSRFRNSLSSLFAFAVDSELMKSNPVLATKLPRGTGKAVEAIRPFTESAFEATLEAQYARSPCYAEITEFMRYSALRWGELVALRVSDVLELPYFALLVARSESDGYDEKGTKNGKSRRVPLIGRAAEIVRARIDGKSPDERIFTSPMGKRLNGGNFKRALAWDVTAPGYRVHDLRHTCATTWLQSGVDVKTVSVWLGHSDTAVTLRIYIHYMGSDSDIAAIRRVEESVVESTSATVVSITRKVTR